LKLRVNTEAHFGKPNVVRYSRKVVLSFNDTLSESESSFLDQSYAEVEKTARYQSGVAQPEGQLHLLYGNFASNVRSVLEVVT
jgi:hypothetical protein